MDIPKHSMYDILRYIDPFSTTPNVGKYALLGYVWDIKHKNILYIYILITHTDYTWTGLGVDLKPPK